MINKVDVWNNALEVMQAFTPYYQKEAMQRIEDADARQAWFVLLLARGAEPRPLTLDYFREINPYSSPFRLAELLEQAFLKGFLTEDTPGSYQLALPGRSVLDAFFETAYSGLSQAPSLPELEMNRLAQLLANIVQATEMAPRPQRKLALASSRWSEPTNGAAAVLKVDQFITDLLRYRDDAHIAAWRPTGVSGQEWEALTFVWNGEATDAAELAEKLAGRGYSEEDYAAALSNLTNRGWLSERDDQYALTAEGTRVRINAEEETDRLFYTGWSVLNHKDLHTLNELLGELLALFQESAVEELVVA